MRTHPTDLTLSDTADATSKQMKPSESSDSIAKDMRKSFFGRFDPSFRKSRRLPFKETAISNSENEAAKLALSIMQDQVRTYESLVASLQIQLAHQNRIRTDRKAILDRVSERARRLERDRDAAENPAAAIDDDEVMDRLTRARMEREEFSKLVENLRSALAVACVPEYQIETARLVLSATQTSLASQNGNPTFTVRSSTQSTLGDIPPPRASSRAHTSIVSVESGSNSVRSPSSPEFNEFLDSYEPSASVDGKESAQQE
jgi:hypothetical protein